MGNPVTKRRVLIDIGQDGLVAGYPESVQAARLLQRRP